VSYRELSIAVPGVVAWEREIAPAGRIMILPDGCLDLIWDGERLFVAGPDTAARWHQGRAGAVYAALRFSGGTGPAILGVPADEVVDRAVDLDEIWPPSPVRALAERVASGGGAALEAWAVERAAVTEIDRIGSELLAMASGGLAVGAMARRLCMGPRQLHRRSLPLFGYGPRRLARVMRLHRALAAGRAGWPLARVAADCGFADQAHMSREARALAGTTMSALLRSG
jgi:AraC-like DNA-binding protein